MSNICQLVAVALIVIVAIIHDTSCFIIQDGVQSTTHQPNIVSQSKEGHYRFASVAADAAECSQIGTEIMARDGGSAVDAAIAAILCDGIHNAQSCGIGGGNILTYYQRNTGKAYTIIAREMAPRRASEDMFINQSVSSVEGGMAIAVPGEIRGLHDVWKIGGRLPWKHLFQPTIKLCRDGFKVGQTLAETIQSTIPFYRDHANLRELVTNPQTGTYYRKGEIMRRPKLAMTLEIIANEGPDAFYNGSLSVNITRDIQDAGGIITEDDLRGYTAIQKDPLIITLHDQSKVFSPPPPSSGAVYQLILNILDGYNFTNSSITTDQDAIVFWHRVVEAFKHAYSQRTHLGDDNVENENFKNHIKETIGTSAKYIELDWKHHWNATEIIDTFVFVIQLLDFIHQTLIGNMTSLEYGKANRAKINDNRTFGTGYYEPQFDVKTDHGTSHISVLGPNGDAVSITSTINLFFGSKVVGSRTGIIFNDEMDDFSTPNTINAFGVPASPANFIKPGKRPLSSMTPSVVIGPDSDVRLVVGASGGTSITTATALVTMETLWLKWGIKEAIDFPRIHHQLVPQRVDVERGFPQVIINGLKAKGHNITMLHVANSRVQGVYQRSMGDIYANCDYRKHGEPDGY